jgi:hypothetical protein
VTARLGTDEDKERLWPRLVDLYPAWKHYVKWTDREFRLFALDPRGGRGTDRGERETTG